MKSCGPEARAVLRLEKRRPPPVLDGGQVQRWSEALSRRLVQDREAELEAYQRGVRPASLANASALLVVGMDGIACKPGKNGAKTEVGGVRTTCRRSPRTSRAPGDRPETHGGAAL